MAPQGPARCLLPTSEWQVLQAVGGDKSDAFSLPEPKANPGAPCSPTHPLIATV